MIKLIEAYISESKNEQRAVRHYLTILIKHMLKCKYQNDYVDKSSWRYSIYNSHNNLVLEFKAVGKGSLFNRYYMHQMDLNRVYQNALLGAIKETGKLKTDFPLNCEWKLMDFVDDKFIDDFISRWGQDCG